MNILRIIVASAVLTWGGPVSVAAADAVGFAEKAALQATMQQHINSQLVDGAYLHLNRATGKIRELYPLAAHPVILQVGKYFVLCSDFRDQNGKTANIDFYIAPRNGGYIVFQTVVDDRKRLGLFRKITS